MREKCDSQPVLAKRVGGASHFDNAKDLRGRGVKTFEGCNRCFRMLLGDCLEFAAKIGSGNSTEAGNRPLLLDGSVKLPFVDLLVSRQKLVYNFSGTFFARCEGCGLCQEVRPGNAIGIFGSLLEFRRRLEA